ncbi:MAG: hypothetical protein CO030_03330 [Candidatus Magasanikbacteria bacterium CG_4_9_14_0_2_um_filter_42_11]|uniref:Uncharacterized protein n=1 Tax=Candidatus Magasanikbacteria bacterium CG_4_9_14_0_2_um_filter_42_11 TaxID=1974643 RepID=A0A2M8F9H5_9BACT|nr:MAG: hypothetical protein COY70_03905 [Candidatus Magasanikbacteria bacterium CG_4_10_14_0_8_um_filter_42_12]PJC52356.1 MAG: hypothetical protein CO030_03330 [Candidatus Magasanikbacteria bacterium CG_4_9_14_0_2_um_filter_42_11]
MILYLDTYITDTPLNQNKAKLLDDVRLLHSTYKKPSKIDIVKYTLSSYAVFPWSNVYIKYEIEDTSKISELDEYIKKLFPDAIIEHERSDSQDDYIKSLDVLETFDDPWIFYVPNNDHPLMINSVRDIEYMNRLLEEAETWKVKFPFVSIAYSHFSEYLNASYPRSANHRYFGAGSVYLGETDDAVIFLRKNGDFNSVQIVNRDHFSHWFTSTDLSGCIVRRAEDLHNVTVHNQVIIAPKKQLCAHFDGYEHMQRTVNNISQDIAPVLFIPEGFFEKNIKIAYGYNTYKHGYTNINPAARKHSFRDSKHGADMRISLSQLPLFWKSRISELDLNGVVNHKKLNAAAKNNVAKLSNPWSVFSLGFSKENVLFQIKLYSRPILVRIGLYGILKKWADKAL